MEDRDGAHVFKTFSGHFNPFIEEKILHGLFPDLCETAAEDMLGELQVWQRPVNAGSGAGPGLSQLFDRD
jgi:hypothetical protein